MCDYSLEAFQSRPARWGEEYISNRFPSGSIGFVSPGDQSVAICMACDMELELSHIPSAAQAQAGVNESERVTFMQLDGPFHRDAVRFANGKVLTLQALGAGVTAWLVATPESAKKEPVTANLDGQA
jgi:hypothetical protein